VTHENSKPADVELLERFTAAAAAAVADEDIVSGRYGRVTCIPSLTALSHLLSVRLQRNTTQS